MNLDELTDVAYEVDSGLAWITLNRPERFNAFRGRTVDELIFCMKTAWVDRSVGVIALTGAGDRAFCAGGDQKQRAETGDYGPTETGIFEVESLHRVIRDLPKPVIAAVNGTAAGMGAHLALACDLVVCSDRARFIEVFARRGLVPDALGPWLLPRLIGMRRTMELFLLAEDITADRALELGLVNRIVPHDDLTAETTEWAERLASGPTRSFALTKWLVNQSLDVDRATMIQNEALAVELNSYTADSEEGIASFRERREPRWKGY